MCNALVEELCLFVSDCLRVSHRKRETLFFFLCFIFLGGEGLLFVLKSTCSGTLNMRAARKKIPVFVSKFGEIILHFFVHF